MFVHVITVVLALQASGNQTAQDYIDTARAVAADQQAKVDQAAALQRTCSKLRAKDAGTLRQSAKQLFSKALGRLGYLGPRGRSNWSILIAAASGTASAIPLQMWAEHRLGYYGWLGRGPLLTRILLPVVAIATVAGLVTNAYLQQQNENILSMARKAARKSLEGFVKQCGASAGGKELDSAIDQAAK